MKHENVEDKTLVLPGWDILPPGTVIEDGDMVWRYAFNQFIPFSPSQIKTCDRVLSVELVIRKSEGAK
jgi:hypothetical protein